MTKAAFDKIAEGLNEVVLVNRVARAICAAYGNEWDESLDDSLYAPANHPGLPGKDDWRDMARAAISAMSETQPQ